MAVIRRYAPRRFVEIGSGHSTRMARYAQKIFSTPTTITSIDPQPRSDIDSLCDNIIRRGAEDVDISVFDDLSAGDILFIDNSHRILQNSDATVFFLETLPRLRPGVIVHIHDIFLPYDYPPKWRRRFYSEQYALAAYLLGAGADVEILGANAYVSGPDFGENPLTPMWDRLGLGQWQRDRHQRGQPDSSFWFTKRPKNVDAQRRWAAQGQRMHSSLPATSTSVMHILSC